VDEREIFNFINTLKNNMSSGIDKIPIKLLKHVENLLLKPLRHLVSSSFVSGLSPQRLKIAETVRLHKKGEVAEISNLPLW
jgi:hypothetical protein